MLDELKSLAEETLNELFPEFVNSEINKIIAESFIIKLANDTRFKCIKFEDTSS